MFDFANGVLSGIISIVLALAIFHVQFSIYIKRGK